MKRNAVTPSPVAGFLEDVNDVTVIFGRNGSGKSQLLRFIRDQDKTRKHYASPKRGGQIALNPSYVLEFINQT